MKEALFFGFIGPLARNQGSFRTMLKKLGTKKYQGPYPKSKGGKEIKKGRC